MGYGFAFEYPAASARSSPQDKVVLRVCFVRDELGPRGSHYVGDPDGVLAAGAFMAALILDGFGLYFSTRARRSSRVTRAADLELTYVTVRGEGFAGDISRQNLCCLF
jgi:hypothetical protein